MAVLVPFDRAVFAVGEDHDDQVEAKPERGFEFLVVHHEASIPRHRHRFLVRLGELRCNRAGQRDAHAGEAVGDHAGVRGFGLVHPRHPHFVGADIGDHDVFRIERGSRFC